MSAKKIAVIPARFDSERLPGKPLRLIGNIPLIERVYTNTLKMEWFDEIVVATDHDGIYSFCQSKEIPVSMTSKEHASGTDRVAEVAKNKEEGSWILNIQGDEPFVEKAMIGQVLDLLQDGAQIATLCRPLVSPQELSNENLVKVVRSLKGKCLYFSRSPIPYIRQGKEEGQSWPDHLFFAHLGIYGFKRETLLELQKLPVSPLEKTEKLEQLRWLENDYLIHASTTGHTPKGIDTPEDLEWANRYVEKHKD
jgi:3-deoxy-manno-octulosonate cytidylyltransferase (CMP-KDO synthetase)